MYYSMDREQVTYGIDRDVNLRITGNVRREPLELESVSTVERSAIEAGAAPAHRIEGVGHPAVVLTYWWLDGWRARWEFDPVTMRPSAPTFTYKGKRRTPTEHIKKVGRFSDAFDRIRDLMSDDVRIARQTSVMAAEAVNVDARAKGYDTMISGQLADSVQASAGNVRVALLRDWRIGELRDPRGRRESVDTAKVLQLYRDGLPVTEIEARLGVKASTVRSIARRAGEPRRTPV